jgi:hypothetical protein
VLSRAKYTSIHKISFIRERLFSTSNLLELPILHHQLSSMIKLLDIRDAKILQHILCIQGSGLLATFEDTITPH